MSRYIYPSGYSPDPLDPGVGALAAWDLLAGTARPYTAAETLAALDARAAADLASGLTDLLARARRALDTNATFLALTAPTNAQVLTQVRLLTREVNALIRHALRLPGDAADV